MPTRERVVIERFFDETGGMQLVVHAPFGGRINRAFGLALRKRICRSFDFELQAAANDDAVVLSLGPQHSFPLSRPSTRMLGALGGRRGALPGGARASPHVHRALALEPGARARGAALSRRQAATRRRSSAWRPTI